MTRKRAHTDDTALQVLNQWIAENGQPPTMEEFRQALGVGSTRTALRYLEKLEAAGKIKRWSGARGIRVLTSPSPQVTTREIPLLGVVAAGSLTFAEEDVEAWVRVPESMLKPTTHRFFMLRVSGDSMNKTTIDGEPIESGDLLLVRQQPQAESGAIVVAEVDGETTIKRLQMGPDYAVLKPESDNPEHRPIVLERDFRVQGVAVRVLKRGSELIE